MMKKEMTGYGEFVGYGDSDDGYDAARDAYDMGYGYPVNRRQREEQRALEEENRRNR